MDQRDDGNREEREHNAGKFPLCGSMPGKGGDRQKKTVRLFWECDEDVARIYIMKGREK